MLKVDIKFQINDIYYNAEKILVYWCLASMYVCLCITCLSVWESVYVCLYVCIYMCLHVCLCICMCLHVCLSVCMYVSIYLYTSICLSVCLPLSLSLYFFLAISLLKRKQTSMKVITKESLQRFHSALFTFIYISIHLCTYFVLSYYCEPACMKRGKKNTVESDPEEKRAGRKLSKVSTD